MKDGWSMTITEALPRLAPPGAGLPPVELFFARLSFQWQVRTGTSEGFRQRFLDERQAIAQLIDSTPASQRADRVLIPRLPGLEDSSRYWSVWITLDHLRIVNRDVANVIQMLAAGRIPPGQASTANVKPSETVSSEVERAYEESCDQFLEVVASAGDLPATPRFSHPWFGPLNALEWSAMAGMHLGIHRRQLSAILARKKD
jgi:hypothetical protein